MAVCERLKTSSNKKAVMNTARNGERLGKFETVRGKAWENVHVTLKIRKNHFIDII
jgi:hypothetical protein